MAELGSTGTKRTDDAVGAERTDVGVAGGDGIGEAGELAATAFADEERPAPLVWALRVLGVLVAFGALVAVLMVIRSDDLIRAWANGNPSAQRILERYGIEFLKHPPTYWPGTQTAYTGARAPHFVAPAITLFVVLASLVGVLAIFLRNGFEWARICLTLIIFFAAVASVGGILTNPPALFVVLPIIAIALGATIVVLVWLPATTRYIHPRSHAELSELRERLRH